MRLVAYVRVSSDGQLDGFGPEVYEDQIRKWAKANGHRIVHWCVEAISGKTDHLDREGFNCAVDHIKTSDAEGVVAPSLNRLARQLHVQEAALWYLWRLGAKVFTVEEGQIREDDPDDPGRTFTRQVFGALAQYERAQAVKRMRDGKRAKAAAGKKAAGAYRYGTRAVGTGRERDAGPNEAEQKAIDRILALRAEGRSYRDIAGALDAEGVRPRRAASWSAMSVRNIVERARA